MFDLNNKINGFRFYRIMLLLVEPTMYYVDESSSRCQLTMRDFFRKEESKVIT